MVNMGVSIGLLPVTGQPLPLISRGGSSILGTSVSFGILLALSRLIRQEQLERAKQAVEQEETGIEEENNEP